MLNRFLTGFFVGISICIQNVSAKEIAITFDDSPREAFGYFSGPVRAQKLLIELKRSTSEKVAFFAVSSQLNEEGRRRLMSFANAGHFIGNHTQGHEDLNMTSSEKFINSIESAHSALSSFPNYKKWFRFPYLHEGNEQDKKLAVKSYMEHQGYTNAYITVNNYDWYLDSLFQNALKERSEINFDKLKKFYVNTIISAVEFYDSMAVSQLGRSPKHVLLLHETDLNALFIGDVLKALKARQWKIISPEDAFQDEISKMSYDKALKFNPGRIGEIARSKGVKNGLWHDSCDEEYLSKKFNEQVLD